METTSRAAEVRDDLRRWHAELKRIAAEMEDAIEEMADCQAADFLEVAQESVSTASRIAKQTVRRTIKFPPPYPDDGRGNSDQE